MALCRKGDLRKCVPIYAVGAALLFCGLPLMITGIAGQFDGADLVGYVGGICIFFGLGFFLLWHMFTIENIEKNVPPPEYDPSLKNVQDVVKKSRAREMDEEKLKTFPNLAYEEDLDSNAPLADADIDGGSRKASTNTSGDNIAAVEASQGNGGYQVLDTVSQKVHTEDLPVEITPTADGGARIFHTGPTSTILGDELRETSSTDSRNSIPVEVL